MDDDKLTGCISCMRSNDLYFMDNRSDYNYRILMETYLDIKIDMNLKYMCNSCIEKLNMAAAFKMQFLKTLSIIKDIQDGEYLDENIFDEDIDGESSDQALTLDRKDLDDNRATKALNEPGCVYYEPQLTSTETAYAHTRLVAHATDPRSSQPLTKYRLHVQDVMKPTRSVNVESSIAKTETQNRQYGCHFCEKVYNSRKACFTHLRMKHGLKFTVDESMKNATKKRTKCPKCTQNFSKKQILNKHLWKVHGMEEKKRKAFVCPLCNERVSYGSNFSAHLLLAHKVNEQIEHLEFCKIDDFLLFKSTIQQKTKFRFRKTTASKQTIEGVRSHYMCSQSGVYVYQGKGKRPAPERQIYKTGKACPAHMIVTETMDRVLVTFYKTHVGHGPCPYYEPREPKPKAKSLIAYGASPADLDESHQAWVCDTCGLQFDDSSKFSLHVAGHSLNLLTSLGIDLS